MQVIADEANNRAVGCAARSVQKVLEENAELGAPYFNHKTLYLVTLHATTPVKHLSRWMKHRRAPDRPGAQRRRHARRQLLGRRGIASPPDRAAARGTASLLYSASSPCRGGSNRPPASAERYGTAQLASVEQAAAARRAELTSRATQEVTAAPDPPPPPPPKTPFPATTAAFRNQHPHLKATDSRAAGVRQLAAFERARSVTEEAGEAVRTLAMQRLRCMNAAARDAAAQAPAALHVLPAPASAAGPEGPEPVVADGVRLQGSLAIEVLEPVH